MVFGIYPDCEMTMTRLCVWVSGGTYQVREQLKADGFKWSAKKRAWWMPIADYMGKIAAVDAEAEDYTVMGTASDGSAVVIAECHHKSL